MLKKIIIMLLSSTSLLIAQDSNVKFGGQIPIIAPVDAEHAIQVAYGMFSDAQIQSIKEKPYLITDYNLPQWIEANWIKRRDSKLRVWFLKNGISIKSSMSLFVLRGVQYKIEGRPFDIKSELRKSGWKKCPPPAPKSN